jgi:hypothetical protein
MVLSSSKVSVNTTVQGPSVFSLNCHPIRSRPESDEGRCRVEAVSGIKGATLVGCGSSVKNVLSNCSPSSDWVLKVGSCVLLFAMTCMLDVRLRSWSNLLAPGTTRCWIEDDAVGDADRHCFLDPAVVCPVVLE